MFLPIYESILMKGSQITDETPPPSLPYVRWKNDTFMVTARCEMQKKAEIRDVLRTKMMDFPFKPGGQNFYCNIFSLLLFPHLA